MKAWLKSWWVTLRYGSRLTRAGRDLRRNLEDDDITAFVEATPPTAAMDCRLAGCRWGNHKSANCECRP